MKSRRKDKKKKDVEDMISVFKTTDPDQLPVFVAYDLHKLPPISFDHVDVTKLLKDILVLRSEITNIKNEYVTKEHLEESLQKVSYQLPNSLFNHNVNKIIGGGYTTDSGPFGLSPLAHRAETQSDSVLRGVDDSASRYSCLAPPNTHDAPCSTDVSTSLVNSTVLENTDDIAAAGVDCNLKKPTMVDVLKHGKWKTTGSDWTVVQSKKFKNRFNGKTGRATSADIGNFRAAEYKIPLFISNVNKETTDNDICEYIHKMTKESVQLEKINMKTDRPYNAFKLFVTKHKMNVFLDDKLWPEGIRFRRFIYFKTKKDRDSSQLKDDKNTTN
jgi:hypothetical protein